MKIKDIVNRDLVNLTNCEQEPIHIPGSIQPHGFLAGITVKDHLVDFCSGNIADFTGYTIEQVLGKPFERVFGSDNYLAVSRALSRLPEGTAPVKLVINGKRFLCTIHTQGSTHIIEAEPLTGADEEIPDTYEQTRKFLHYMEQTSTLRQLCDSIARETRELTGYDRVMIYRFDAQYNGEVFAESVRDDLEPFLGLHYPHTDIPVQARELYMKNLLRIIVDINYEPVPVYTIDDREGKNLDLSHSILRSTSPIHVQYLQNMGVGATLTISLIHNNRLWGLIACHHYSAKNISHAVRSAAKLQGHFITSQIDVRQSNEEYEIARQTNEALEKFQSIIFSSSRISFSEIAQNPALLNICNASGVCIMVKNELFTGGKTPSHEQLKALAGKLYQRAKNSGLATAKLTDLFPEAEEICDSAAGLIYHSLGFSDTDCIMWFRGETITEVNWAGDPAKAILKDEKGLNPRNSFKLWKQVVKCQSNPWLQPELIAAANYAHTLQKHVTYISLSEEEERSRMLNEELRQNNEELENLNWISTHDLQEPLRKIQIMASRLLSSEDTNLSQKTKDLVGRMNDSAQRMQVLLRDILNYTRIKYTEDKLVRVNLTTLLAEVIGELDDNIRDKGAKITVTELPEITGVPFLVKQLFTNLINNSLKFSDEHRPQHITVRQVIFNGADLHLDPSKNYHHITLTDTGIGFEQKFSEPIFRIFTRLHNQNEYQGSGVGLALCRKIMQAHHGFISAVGKPGEGASFNLYFPA